MMKIQKTAATTLSVTSLIVVAGSLVFLPFAEVRAAYALGNIEPGWNMHGALIFIARWSPPVACVLSAGLAILASKWFRRQKFRAGLIILLIAMVMPITALIFRDRVELMIAFPPGYQG